MKANIFYSLKEIQGKHIDFHRKKGICCRRGIYFWGFTIREDAGLPQTKDELVIYYIGKSKKNVIERMMQEFTQLIFGGFGTIIDYNWLIKYPHKSKIFEKQESDKKGTKQLDAEVLYESDGPHVLYDFFQNQKIQSNLNWMRERLIFSWIDLDLKDDIEDLELEFHEYVKSNILGLRGRVNFPNKNNFIKIDWTSNYILKEWLEEVKRNL